MVLLTVASVLLGLWAMGETGLEGPPALGLQVDESDGLLRIQWDRSSSQITRAQSGTLEITDGARQVSLPLDAPALRKGSVTYARTQARVDLHLTVEYRLGRAQEYASFLGREILGPASAQSEPAQLSGGVAEAEKNLVLRERNQARREAERLRETNRVQALRIRDLEEAMRILRQRVTAAEASRPR